MQHWNKGLEFEVYRGEKLRVMKQGGKTAWGGMQCEVRRENGGKLKTASSDA